MNALLDPSGSGPSTLSLFSAVISAAARRGVRFLRRSGQTVAHVEFRLRLNMLSSAIEEHAAQGAQGEKETEQAITAS